MRFVLCLISVKVRETGIIVGEREGEVAINVAKKFTDTIKYNIVNVVVFVNFTSFYPEFFHKRNFIKVNVVNVYGKCFKVYWINKAGAL